MQQDAQGPALFALHKKTGRPKQSLQCTEEIPDDQLYRALEENNVTTLMSESGLGYVALKMPTSSTPQTK